MATLADIRNANWQLATAAPGDVVQGYADIQQCLETLLYTVKGTAVLRPQYGIDLPSYIDRPLTEVVPLLKREIIDQVEAYEPRVDIEKIEMAIEEISRLRVRVYYVPKNSNRREVVDLYYIVS
jgi:phage baseplate assembly protein W